MNLFPTKVSLTQIGKISFKKLKEREKKQEPSERVFYDFLQLQSCSCTCNVICIYAFITVLSSYQLPNKIVPILFEPKYKDVYFAKPVVNFVSVSGRRYKLTQESTNTCMYQEMSSIHYVSGGRSATFGEIHCVQQDSFRNLILAAFRPLLGRKDMIFCVL